MQLHHGPAMNRTLLALSLALPSLAFACGGGQGLGDSVFGLVGLAVFYGGPLLLVAGVVATALLVARAWTAADASAPRD